MTNEPVAYIGKHKFFGTEILDREKPWVGYEITPLYTKRQLQPRVKMTQVEFDEWKEIFNDFEFFSDALSQGVTVEKHVKLFTKIYLTKHNDLSSLEIEVKLARLWADFNPDNPEETIEIVPEKKWFVRSKEKYQPDMDQGISESGYLYLTQGNIYSIEYYETTPFKEDAQQFDTKEQAEEWKNPLTEVVLLPVDE